VSALEPGTKWPALALRDQRGAPVVSTPTETLFAVFKTTCPTCELTWPYLDRIRAAAEGGTLSIVAISQDDPPSSKAFADRLGTRMDTVYDLGPWPASDALGVTTVPTLFRVTADGAVAETIVGFDRVAMEGLARRAAKSAGRPAAPLFRPEEKVPLVKPG
jgi:peroxiredoxin